jgi:ribosome recycling factor
MSEEVNFVIAAATEAMEGTISHLETGLAKIRAGRASAQMLDGLFVDYYGSNSPLSNVANVSTPDARTLAVQPWEKGMLEPIMKAIQAANLGFNPNNNGTVIMINIPPLTEERRRDLVKRTKAEGESGKVGLRGARKDANEEIKKLQKDGLPVDEAKDAEDKIQQLTDAYTLKVDKHLEAKEKEIMTV